MISRNNITDTSFFGIWSPDLVAESFSNFSLRMLLWPINGGTSNAVVGTDIESRQKIEITLNISMLFLFLKVNLL